MKSYTVLLTDHDRIDADLVEEKKRKSADALSAARQLRKEFGYTASKHNGEPAKKAA